MSQPQVPGLQPNVFVFFVGFPFFGVQYGKQCFCGTEYGRYGEAEEADCDMPCSGNQDQMCGGRWRASIYSTGCKYM